MVPYQKGMQSCMVLWEMLTEATFSQMKSPCELSKREVTSPPNLKVVSPDRDHSQESNINDIFTYLKYHIC